MPRRHAGFFLCLWVSPVLASNFGDLPKVLPVFWIGLFVSIIMAAGKASQQNTETGKTRFDIVMFLLYLLLGTFCSGVLLAILWVFSF
jgi:hypothetical protein